MTKGIGDVSERKGVPVRARRRVASVKASRTPSPHDRESPAVVDLVEDDEGAIGAGTRRVDRRIGADLRVGGGHTVEVGTGHTLRVREVGVDVNAEACGARGPLAFEVLGGAHDGQLIDDAASDQLGRKREGEVVLPAPGVATARKSRGEDAM